MASPSSCLVLCVLLFLLSAYWYCVVSGVCYHEGKGVDKDDEKAVELWTKSAKQDNQDAKFILGWAEDTGGGEDA